MNSQNANGWPTSSGPGAPSSLNNDHPPVQSRQISNYGPNHPNHPTSTPILGLPSLVHQSPFYSSQANGHALPNPVALAQASPIQASRGQLSSQQLSPTSIQNHSIPAPSYALPRLGQAMQHQQSPPTAMTIERDRERERDVERDRHRQQDMIVQMDYDREMESRDQRQQHQQHQQHQHQQHQHQQHQTHQTHQSHSQHQQLHHQQHQQHHLQQHQHQHPHQHQQQLLLQQHQQQQQQQQQHEQNRSPRENHASSIPLQHPVASRVPATLHGPNGLLSPQHPVAGVSSTQPSVPLGAPSGPGNIFGNGAHTANENSPRPFIQQAPQNNLTQQLLGFGGNNIHQLPNGMAALSQGQQPILNDALSYLDQVKFRFAEHPDVYNRFLDIMKDFKSQAIDTPGVIERVSSLFTGHPELIQGFNTFLPPGYLIECGLGDNQNAIRVTTPSGRTTSEMPSVHNRLNGGGNGPHSLENNNMQGLLYREGPQPKSEWPQQQQENSAAMTENPFSPGGRHVGLSLFSPQANLGQGNGILFEREELSTNADTATVEQREQRGVSHLSNAVSAVATIGAQSRPTAQASPGAEQVPGLGQMAAGINGDICSSASGNQLGLEKRGPVEFNHAIGYVNKIKKRYSHQPEIYKQFLEILQTYQRESKPIQDVYAQVTQLFHPDPDLLEDFKQFLPESAAQAKAQAAARQATEDATMLSNVRGDNNYFPEMRHSQAQTPKPEKKMPPLGNFAPPSVGKENKKRKGGAGSQVTGGAGVVDSGSVPAGQNSKNGNLRVGNTSKRARIEPIKPSAPEIPPMSPTLVPSLPVPLAPTPTPSAMSDELTFFDRVKKYINNKQTFNEFLKLCNLFSQDLIDKNILFHKASTFIGGNPDLIFWFKGFIKYEGRDEIIPNEPKIGGDKVVLSNCRGLSPSYRLLPKREKLRVCSGRDELCNSVLNDEWVSHPTWASEDSGFIAHRKNHFEEILHRIEEERHDYDFNIEACTRTIQLMEPIAQQLKLMSDDERSKFTLPPGLGGQSQTIYERVIKKVYDRVRGQIVIDDLFKGPATVLPLLLRRLKQKQEEWKASQREWEKVWRDQTNKLFWKSLDHQNINKADKRQFQPKALLTEIQVKSDEQKRQSIAKWNTVPKYQFLYHFDDDDVIQDTCHLILIYLQHSYGGNAIDQSRLEIFIKTFIPTFFDLEGDSFQRKMSDVYDATPTIEEVDDDSFAVEEQAVGRGRRAMNGRRGNLLRGVLDRGQPSKTSQKEKDDAGLDQSKETTPDVQSMDEDVMTSQSTPTEQPTRNDTAEHRWMEHPSTGNTHNRQNINYNEPFKRENYNLYASANIYCFCRMFEMLYQRLALIKENEKEVHEVVRRSRMAKPAYDLKLIDKKPSDFFSDVSLNANYYRQILKMCEEVAKGDNSDMGHLEETLRQFYLQNGWSLHSFDKMIAALLRFALQILVSDNKDKSLDIINLFYKDRKDSETTHQAELTYRKQVEKLVKDGDIFRIRYTPSTKVVTVAIFKKDDKTFELDEMAETARWSYYISTFAMRDLTEGIDLSKVRWPFLKRNMPPPLDTEEEYNRVYTPQWNADNLVIRISPNNYHMQYDPNTQDWWVHDRIVRERGMTGMEEARQERKTRFRGKFGDHPSWMDALPVEDIARIEEDFRSWVKGDETVSVDEDDNKAQEVAPAPRQIE